jgi:glucokinase
MELFNNMTIGIDIGATKIAAALVTPEGHVIATQNQSTNTYGGKTELIDSVAGIINGWLEKYDTDIQGIGVGVSGIVDPINGLVIHAANLGWENVPLKSELENRIKNRQNISIQNDTNAEVLGEYYFGAGRGFHNIVYHGIGTGFGSGVIINDHLLIGNDNKASEIGHLSLDPDGKQCSCGLKGCIETILSGPGILEATNDLLMKNTYSTLLLPNQQFTTQDILVAAFNNDPLAVKVMSDFASVLSFVVSIYIAVFNPGCIILGGGIGRASFDLVLPIIKKELVWRVPESRYQNLKIVRSKLISSAIGASCLARHQINHK